jgi:hypothetical protein
MNDSSRMLSPLERSEVLYKEGKEKIQKINESASLNRTYNEQYYTGKPEINKKSRMI